jgi:hypothetical protein
MNKVTYAELLTDIIIYAGLDLIVPESSEYSWISSS